MKPCYLLMCICHSVYNIQYLVCKIIKLLIFFFLDFSYNGLSFTHFPQNTLSYLVSEDTSCLGTCEWKQLSKPI